MRIKVTQDDIDNGKKQSVTMCPISLAIKREMPGHAAFVHIDGSIFTYPSELDEKHRYRTSSQIIDFIEKFDSEAPVEPFEFELEEVI